MAQVVVIGGGIAGLATAVLLAGDGHDVEILERGTRVGGRAGWIEDAGFRFDTGPSWYLMPGVYEHFYRLAGTSTEHELDLVRLDPGYRVMAGPDRAGGGAETPAAETPDVETLDVPADLEAILALARARGVDLTDHLATARSAMDLALEWFLYNPFTSLRWATDPALLSRAADLAGWLGTDLSSFVERVTDDPLLRQLLSYHAIFLGTDPRRAPAIYHLMSEVDLHEGVLYPRGGFAAVVRSLEALARRAGVRITLEADVEEIVVAGRRRSRRDVAGGRGRVRGVAWRDGEGQRRRSPADVVVSTADLHHTETQLVPPAYRTWPERTWDDVTPGPSAVLVMLGVRGEIDLPHHTLLFTREWERSFDAVFGGGAVAETTSLYVSRTSATDDDAAPPGHENLFLLVPVSGEVGLGRGTGYPEPFLGPADRAVAAPVSDGDAAAVSDGDAAATTTSTTTTPAVPSPHLPDPEVERIADRAVAQLADWAGIPDLASRVVVRHTLGPADFADYRSWRDGMLGPAHTLAQSAMFRRGVRSRLVDGLLYAGGTAQPGVGVPMCLISAELVLKSLRGDSSPGPLPEVPA